MRRALPEPEYYAVSEAAAIAAVNHMTIRRAIDRGELKRFQLGRKVLIKRAEFRAWLENLSVSNAA
jgi:excisionase family DNA binding protein